MTFFIATALLSVDPVPAPWDTEASLKALEARVAALESKPAVKASATTCPCGIPGCKCGCASGGVCTCMKSPVAAKADAPTYHFPDNTKCTVDQFGNVTCSNQPTTMSYPGGPYRQAIQQSSGDCSDGSCQPQQQRRGLFRGGGLFKRRWGT